MKKESCHLFRHAMSTQILENGADLRVNTGDVRSPRSVESTQLYKQVSIRALQAILANMHPAECVKSEHSSVGNDEYD